ncbi:MAG TPA: hypothetical protein VFJ85_08345 [Acidimicrobiales bacterium]|nr:hypothetical protein [Acidimicrobiales bacterium]
MRRTLSVVVGALVTVMGAVTLGEYQLTGITAIVAGALFGLVVAELMLVVGRKHDAFTMVVAGSFSAVGMVWASWIWFDHRLGWIAGAAWVGAAVAPVAAWLWLRNPGRPAAGSRQEP